MWTLVTGGAGYLGSWLVRKLLRTNHPVRVVDSLLYGGDSLIPIFAEPNMEFVRGDLRISQAHERWLHEVDTVVHLSSLVGDKICNRFPEAAEEINCRATCEFFDTCRRFGVRRFIFASTCSNYGITDPEIFVDEEAPLNPVSLYATTKVNAERYIQDHNDGKIQVFILRFATLFGISPRMRFDLLLNELTWQAVTRKRIELYGPKSWRPFLHVRDAVEAILLCLSIDKKKGRGTKILNVGSGALNVQKDVLADILARLVPSVRVETQEQKRDPRNYKVSFERMVREFGFSPQRTLEQGIIEVRNLLDSGLISRPVDTLDNIHPEETRV